LLLFIFDLLTGYGVSKTGSFYLPALLIAVCIGIEAAFWVTAKFFLTWAQRWIADRERTRHWYEEPIYRRSRRPVTRAPIAR
jgi:hypothetical protein